MKKTIFTFFSALLIMAFVNQAFAQVPQGFNYQAVARNSAGTLLQNQALGVKLDIHQGSASGTVVYSERQTPSTNTFGLFTVTVGQGTFLSGSAFNTINWSTGNYWLEVGLDVSGGTTYTAMGTSQLLSVPYAMYAGSSASASLPTGSNGQTLRHDGANWVANSYLYNNGTNIGIGITTPASNSLLHVHAASGYALERFTSTTTGTTTGDGFVIGQNSGAGDIILYNFEAQPIRFGTNGSERMRIDATGNIGIGIATPTAQLHTTGSLLFAGAGTPGLNKVLTSDATGNATWQVASTLIQSGLLLPTGSTAQTLRHDGTNWVANSLLYNNGTKIGINTLTPSGIMDVNYDANIYTQMGTSNGALKAVNGSNYTWLGYSNYAAIFNGNVIPNLYNAFDLGTSSYAFRDLYLANKIFINGTSPANSVLSTDATGNATWQAPVLPVNSLSGATTYLTNSIVNYSGGTVTITVPRSGVIIVEANTMITMAHVTGTQDLISLNIGTSATDGGPTNDIVRWSIPASFPTTTGSNVYNFTVRRMFTVMAGTYTYYLNGFMVSGANGDDRFEWSSMIATFY